MDFFEKRRGGSFVYTPPELYPVEIAKVITSRLEIDPDSVAGYLETFFTQCEQLLRVYRFDQLPALANQLEQDLRKAKLTLSRPDESAVIAGRETIHARGHAVRWISAEIDAAEEMAKPHRIVAITWRGVTVEGGREISREEVRATMRSAAYDGERWREYLASLPRIEAPEKL
jgi:hypothetical protein